jgi:NAD(P)-dependent dehydrogenase (short-subunit alcohol dehydrogenase family)
MATVVSSSTITPSLEGKTALITGSSRGIGAAIAQRLSEAGAHVILVGRGLDKLTALAEELPGQSTLIQADLGDPDAPAHVFEKALAATGRIDVLVNNAGMSSITASDELTVSEIDSVFALNVRAALLLSGLAAAKMSTNGGGSIVNISSVLGVRGSANASIYSASKGAMDGAARALAAEWGKSGVRVNTVRPAVTRSDMSAPILSLPGFESAYVSSVPLARIGEGADIAEAVLFLSSDASAYITGQAIDVDGGVVNVTGSVSN